METYMQSCVNKLSHTVMDNFDTIAMIAKRVHNNCEHFEFLFENSEDSERPIKVFVDLSFGKCYRITFGGNAYIRSVRRMSCNSCICQTHLTYIYVNQSVPTVSIPEVLTRKLESEVYIALNSAETHK